MRETLKEIARYYNESAVPGPAQKAAEKARKTLEDLKLLYEKDVHSIE
jgi:hypothetical protein